MPNQTTNLGLTTWLESDVVDFEQMNANFEKIDALVNCIESGTKIGTFSDGGATNTATWHYKKYSNGSIELDARLVFDNLICASGDGIPYYSDSVSIVYPFSFSSVYSLSIHAVSNNIIWATDISGGSSVDGATFRVLTRSKESSASYKQVYISVKGWLAS